MKGFRCPTLLKRLTGMFIAIPRCSKYRCHQARESVKIPAATSMNGGHYQVKAVVLCDANGESGYAYLRSSDGKNTLAKVFQKPDGMRFAPCPQEEKEIAIDMLWESLEQ